MLLTTFAGMASSLLVTLASPSRALDAQHVLDETSGRLLIRCARLHTGDGEVREDAAVLLRNGLIEAIGSAQATDDLLRAAGVEPGDIVVVEHDGDVSAGLIALHDFSGASGEEYDSTRALLPETRLAYAFDPDHSDFERLVEEGITTIVLTPSSQALAGGLTAVVKTANGRVLDDRAQLHLSVSSVALSSLRYPTSYDGALAEFDARFESGEAVFAEAQAGSLPVLIEAREKHEIQKALDLAQRYGLRGAVSGASRAGELADALRTSGLAVVYRPFDLGMERRSLESVVALAEAGVPFGFSLDAPYRHPASLRLEAAACVREGLSRDAALRALTSDAAAIAGVDKHVGRLIPGMDADLVLWSGDPVDLGSAVVAVYVDGERAYGGEE